MSNKTSRGGGKAATAVAVILAVLIITALAAILINCAGKSAFDVTYNGMRVKPNARVVLPMSGEAEFGYAGDEGELIVNIAFTDNFEYYADGTKYEAKDVDLTPIFITPGQKNGFKLNCTPGAYSLREVLSAVHGGAEITGDLPATDYPYRLTAATTSGKRFTLYFAQLDLKLSATQVTF